MVTTSLPGVAYLLAADKYCQPLPWRLSRLNELVIRSRNPCSRPPLAPLACLCTHLSRSTSCSSPGTVASPVWGWGQGGTQKKSPARKPHTCSVNPAAIAGVHGRHPLAEPLP